MTRPERFSPTDPLAGPLPRPRRASRSAACRTGSRAACWRGSRRATARSSSSRATRAARALAEAALAFFAPDIPTLTFPAWDSLPYDRVSPNAEVSAERMSALHALLAPHKGPRVVFTTANAIVQRVPDRESVARACLSAARRQRRPDGAV